MKVKSQPPAGIESAEGESLLVGQRHGAKAGMSICGINDNNIVEEKSRMSSSFSAEERSCKSVVDNKLEKIKNGFYVGNGVRGDRVVGDVDALFEQACMASEWAIQKTDCLLSMFRYPAEYLEEVRQTRRARGSDGVHWGPFLWFDIDRENDLPAVSTTS